jgi:hypothetical protein
VPGDSKAWRTSFWFPAKDKRVAWRELAALSKLPELFKKFKALEKRLSQLEQHTE